MPRSTRQADGYIEKEFGVVYESRSGLITSLHRLGLEYRKPEIFGRSLDEAKQKAFIARYENLVNSPTTGEPAPFADAAHPTARRAAPWLLGAARGETCEPTSGRQRVNIHVGSCPTFAALLV